MPLIIDSYYQCLLDCKIVFTANKFITSLVKYEIMSWIYSTVYGLQYSLKSTYKKLFFKVLLVLLFKVFLKVGINCVMSFHQSLY